MKIIIPFGGNELVLSFEKKRTKPISTTTLESLSYELQLLLGTNAILSAIQGRKAKQINDSRRFGNVANYYKDSAYLHIRNLLNALINQYIVDGQPIPLIQSGLFGQWKRPIEKFALHINTDRDQDRVSNMIAGVHLNKMIPRLTLEAERCWVEWSDKSSDANLRQELKAILRDKQDAAQADVDRVKRLIGIEK